MDTKHEHVKGNSSYNDNCTVCGMTQATAKRRLEEYRHAAARMPMTNDEMDEMRSLYKFTSK